MKLTLTRAPRIGEHLYTPRYGKVTVEATYRAGQLLDVVTTGADGRPELPLSLDRPLDGSWLAVIP